MGELTSITDLPGVLLTPLKIIPAATGKVLHALKHTDPGFVDFGEAYFSTVNLRSVKGWKRHLRMTLNLVVPIGEIQFALFDTRNSSAGVLRTVSLGGDDYFRLTVPPGIWVAFTGKKPGVNLLMNVASIIHDPAEAENMEPGRAGLPTFEGADLVKD